MKKLTIRIQQRTTSIKGELIIKGEIVSNVGFNEHDVAGILFVLEFAANNYAEIPMRVHIDECISRNFRQKN